jgi:radical SAM protein with 4Fe4S-binding SPASM domain
MDCIVLEELYLNEWSSDLIKQLNGRRYPITGLIELTDRCNFNCVHCYINQPASSRSIRNSELTTNQVKTIIDQLAQSGCLFLTMTGGEVFLRPDFLEIYNYARQAGILVTIFTNGSLITPQVADELSALPPRMVEITLYGASRETYEKVTGVPGSYERCISAIKLLMERGIVVNLKTVVIDLNLHEYDAVKALAEDLGVNFRHDGVMWPRLSHGAQKDPHQIPIDEILLLDHRTDLQKDEWESIVTNFSGKPSRSDNSFTCGAGVVNFHIDSKGMLSNCTMYRSVSYNVLELGFNEAFRRIGELRTLKRQQDTKCRTCTLGGLCQQCPAWSQAVHGDDESPVDFLCALAHRRAELIKKSII